MSNNNLRFAMPGDDLSDNGANAEAKTDIERLPDFSRMTKKEIKEYDAIHGSYKRLLGDKPITFLWLLNHYSKLNADAYKSQKQARKEQKNQSVPDNSKSEELKKSEELNWNREPEKRKAHNYEDSEQRGKPDYLAINDLSDDEDNPKTIRMGASKRKSPYSQNEYKTRPRLVCVGFGQTVDITQTPYLIGRSEKGVNLCIADNPEISSRHAQITERNGQYYISDLDSLNHITINGEKIPRNIEILLKDGMHFKLANEEFIFKVD